MGLENLTDLRYRAFSAGLLDALPAMIDRDYDDDEDDSTTNKGLFQRWGVHVLGHGAYNVGGGGQRGLLGDREGQERPYLGAAPRQAWTELVADFRRAERW